VQDSKIAPMGPVGVNSAHYRAISEFLLSFNEQAVSQRVRESHQCH
jgi:hypothetical protein